MARRFDHLADVEAFVTAVDKGSMTEGAIALSTTPSAISRAVSRLEARLGTQLLRRTTRRLSLTDAGRTYLDQARAAFALVDDAERAIQGQGGDVSGEVRLSVSTTYGHHRLPGMLADFAIAYPKVRVDISITNRNVDLVAEGFDIAIRLGHLPDSSLSARKIEDAHFCLVASPDYLRRMGMPETLEDLARHQCLPFVMPSTGRDALWLFRSDDRDIDWAPSGPVRIRDDVLGTVSLAVSGLGICQTYDFIARPHIEQGRLVRLLPGLEGRSRPVSLLFPPHRGISAALRALIDHLARAAARQA